MKLTSEQQNALESQKNVLVEAGAGSGKTSLFVQRYLHILDSNPDLDASQLLAITYTKKAAAECKARLQVENSNISTIHGFCSQLLRDYCFEAAISPNFSVLDGDDSHYLYQMAISAQLQELSEQHNTDLEALLKQFSEYQIQESLKQCFMKRQSCLSKETQCETALTTSLITLFKQVYKHYCRLKRQVNSLDYDDLLEKTRDLILNPDIRKQLSTQYKVIMVDECQDTDPKQWDIIFALCDPFDPYPSKKLFLVGDSKQSIYSFRGAELSLFESIKQDFQTNSDHCDVVPLTTNFRSSQDILDTINPLFADLFENDDKTPIKYHPLKAFDQELTGKVDALLLKDGNSDADEAEAIGLWIKQLLTENPTYSYKDIAILARQRSYCETLRNALVKQGFPVHVDKQKGFFTQALIIDLFQLVKGILNPHDRLSWYSLFQSPFFGRDMNYCYWLQSNDDQSSVPDLLLNASKKEEVSLNEFPIYAKQDHDLIQAWIEKSRHNSISELLRQIINDNCSESYKKQYPEFKGQSHIFLSIIQDIEQDQRLGRQDLIDKLEFKLSLYDNAFESQNQIPNSISIATIHSMKGLEFPIVFVAGCHKPFYINKSDSMLISKNSCCLNDNSEEAEQYRKKHFNNLEQDIIAEEKRLFYVACTRAKQQLILSGLWEAKSKKTMLQFIKDGPNTGINFHHQLSQLNKPSNFNMNYDSKQHSEISSPSTLSLSLKKQREHLSVSKWIQKNKSDRFSGTNTSLQYYEQSYIGDISHHLIQQFISHGFNESELHDSASKHPQYIFLTSTLKQQIRENIKKIIQSPHLKQFKNNNYIIEYPFQAQIEDTVIKGRLDAFSHSKSHSTILEFKSDFCLSIKELQDRYIEQLQEYAKCLFIYHPSLEYIDIHLYSLHLDDLLTLHLQKTKASENLIDYEASPT